MQNWREVDEGAWLQCNWGNSWTKSLSYGLGICVRNWGWRLALYAKTPIWIGISEPSLRVCSGFVNPLRAVRNSIFRKIWAMTRWVRFQTAPKRRSWKQRLPTVERWVETAQLKTAPTKHGGRKCVSVFRIHHSFHASALRHFTSLATCVIIRGLSRDFFRCRSLACPSIFHGASGRWALNLHRHQ